LSGKSGLRERKKTIRFQNTRVDILRGGKEGKIIPLSEKVLSLIQSENRKPVFKKGSLLSLGVRRGTSRGVPCSMSAGNTLEKKSLLLIRGGYNAARGGRKGFLPSSKNGDPRGGKKARKGEKKNNVKLISEAPGKPQSADSIRSHM